MTKEKGVGRRTQFLDDLKKRRRYWELRIEKDGNNKHKEEIEINFHKLIDLPISSILNNNN